MYVGFSTTKYEHEAFNVFYKDVFFLLPHVYTKTKIKVKFFKNTLKNLTVDLYDLVREINII